MSTFLEICQNVASKSGTVSGTNPTTVTGQVGRLLKIIDYVNEAWDEIQTSQDAWKWMRRDFTKAIASPTQAYTPAAFSLTSFARWDTTKKLYIYETAEGQGSEGEIDYYRWRDFRPTYLTGEIKTQLPQAYSIRDYDSAMVFSNIPDLAYTVRGEYFKDNQVLEADGDIPECPAKYHKAIQYLALQLLAEYDEADYAANKAQSNYADVYSRLVTNQLEEIDAYGGGPLA